MISEKFKNIYFIVDSKNSFLSYRANYFQKLINKKKYKTNLIYFNDYKKTIRKLIKQIKRKSVLYVIDIGKTKFWFCVICKLFLKTKIIFDTGDDYYILNKSKGKKGIKLFYILFIQFFFLKIANIIITRGYYHKKYLLNKGYKNIYQIPDCIDLSHSKRHNTKSLKNKYKLKNNLLIGVMGTINWNSKYQICYGWELLECLNILKKYKIKGIIIGDGSGLPYLKKKAQMYGIKNKICFLGHLPYKDIPKYLSLFDIGLSTQTNNTVGWFRTTGKLPEYLALNIYIIATKIGEAKRVLNGIGSLLPYNGIKDRTYPNKLAKEIKKIYNKRNILNKAKKGRKISELFFSYTKIIKKLDNIINSL